jgi:hypothetical protein
MSTLRSVGRAVGMFLPGYGFAICSLLVLLEKGGRRAGETGGHLVLQGEAEEHRGPVARRERGPVGWTVPGH